MPVSQAGEPVPLKLLELGLGRFAISCHRTVPGARETILGTEMNADLAVVLGPGAEQAGLGWLLGWLGWLEGLAGVKIIRFLKQFIGFLSHRRGSGTRAQNRLGWAGWAGLGWLGWKSSVSLRNS